MPIPFKSYIFGLSASTIAIALAFQVQSAYAQNPLPATAEEDEKPAVGEQGSADIIVSGTRLREESLQEAPVAVSVITKVDVEALHGSDLTAISGKVPNLIVTSQSTTPGLAGFGLRGVQSADADPSTEPAIAVYIDGVYQAIQTGGAADLLDLDQIEVARGPQGTFLGKNAGGGAIILTHTRPSGNFGGNASIDYGSYNHIEGKAALDFPITNGLSGRVFYAHRQRDGYIKSLTAPNLTYGAALNDTGRASLRYHPNSDIDILLASDYSVNRGRPLADRNVPLPTDLQCTLIAPSTCAVTTPYGKTRTAYTNQRYNIKTWNNVLNAGVNLGGVKLTSITGYKQYRNRDLFMDLGGASVPIIRLDGYRTQNDQFSQELRLSSTEDGFFTLDDKLNWIVGGWYGKSKAFFSAPQSNFNGRTSQESEAHRKGYAAFAHADYHITEPWQISAGVRYSHDRTRHDYNLRHPTDTLTGLTFTQAKSWSNVSIEGGTQYQIDRNKMIYYRYAEGYRAGGFQGRPVNVAFALPYEPEGSTSHEVGLRTDWLDRTLRVNLTAFHTKYDNLQVQSVILNNGATGSVTTNAAASVSKGFEIEAVLKPSPNLEFDINYGYLDAHYLRWISINAGTLQPIDFSDRLIRYSPAHTVYIAGQYRIPFSGNALAGFEEAVIRVSYDWRSDYQADATNASNGLVKSYGLLDGNITFDAEGRYSLSAYVKNALDTKYTASAAALGTVTRYVEDAIGRTFGIKFGITF